MSVRKGNKWLYALMLLGLGVLPAERSWGAKPKDKEAKAAAEAKADAGQPLSDTPLADIGPALPDDLNEASLRLRAMDTMYELDLTVDQMKELRQAAAEAASTQSRPAAGNNSKLAAMMRNFQTALLNGTDTEKIDKLRTQISNLTEDSGQIDDDVQITDGARSKAPEVLHQLTASQLAAWLASHADEVGDPVEMMMNTVAEVRDQRADAAAEKEADEVNSDKKTSGENKKDAKKNEAGGDDVDTLIRVTANDVADSVAGLDEAKAKTLSADIRQWIKTTSEMKDDDFASQRKSLQDSAKTLTGNIHPMRVLDHWLQQRIAKLLANPQLPQAIDAMVQAREQTN